MVENSSSPYEKRKNFQKTKGRSIRKEKKRKGEKFRTAFSCVDCHVDTKSGRNQNA